MDIELTKDADLLICCIYKEYLSRRKNSVPKSEARSFDGHLQNISSKLEKWSDEDITDTLQELKKAGLVKTYISGNFELTSDGIIYMENRFKKGLDEVTDFISKFLPW